MTARRNLLALTTVLMAVQAPVFGQGNFDFQAPAPAWTQFRLDPNARITLDFRNASADAVLQRLSQASGVTIIKDPTLTTGITLQSPRPQSLADAFSLLNTVLRLRNFEIVREGNFLVVSPRQPRFGGRGAGGTGADGDTGGFGGRGSQSVLRVYAIKFANATQVSRVINDVFSGTNNPSTQQADGTTPTPANPFAGNNGGGRGQRGNNRRFGGAAATNNAAVKASADDYSNSVIVYAANRDHDQIEKIIAQIDKQTDQPQQSRVFELKYASAASLAPVIQNVLVSNAPRGRGGQGTQTVPIDQRFQQAARFGSAQAAFGTVAAESRTNTLIVTATQDNLSIIEQVIQKLDKPTTLVSSTFVVTLQNARADVIAQLLNQSFNSRNGSVNNSLTGGLLGNNNNNQNRNNINNTNNRPPSLGSTTGRAANISRAAPRPGSPEPEPEPEPDPQQGFGFGGGGGGQFQGNRGGGLFQNQNQNGAPTGVDANGQIVNIQDLSGAVIAVPDISTNSVIVVTSPQNRAIIEQVLAKLDKIPEQVMIETLIVEASLDTTEKLGVEWNFTSGTSTASSSFGLQADTAQPQGFRYTLTGTQYGAFVQALKTDDKFNVLSTPRIFTSNNATAQINISQSLPYVTNQTVDTNGAIFYNYSFLDVGIILTVTPRITSNGYVTMDVTQTANDFVRYTSFNAPVVNQREAQTTVSVQDGETIVLGGIIENSVSATVNKIPLLGDIPIIGNLFRSKNITKSKTELLVFLTPRVVRDAEEARRLRNGMQKELQPRTQMQINGTLMPLANPVLKPDTLPGKTEPLPQPEKSVPKKQP